MDGFSGDCPSSPSYQPSSLVFTPHSPIFTIQSNNIQSSSLSSEDFYYYQDVYLQSKETLPRGSKKPSQPHRVSFTGVGGGAGGGGVPNGHNLTYIDISPLDNETITAKTLPRTSVRNDTNGKIPSKIFASPENFKLSVRSLSQSSRSMISSSPEFMRNHFKQLSTYRYRLHNDQSVSSQSQYSSDSDSFNKRSSEEDPKVFTSGLKRSQAFHTAELLQQQLLVDEEEEFLEEDEDISKSESLNDTQNTFSQESHVSQTSLGATSDLPGGLSRSLKKSTAFHDRTSLEQQIIENEKYQLEMRKKLLEEYVQHVYMLKMDHQTQLEKIEEIYKTNLDDLADVVDGDVDAAVKNVRQKADKALANLRVTDGNGNNRGNCGNGSILKDFLDGKKESFLQPGGAETSGPQPQQLGQDIKLSMSGKLNKLQVYIDNKIGEIRKLNDQVCFVQQEIEQAEKEKENLKQLMDELA